MDDTSMNQERSPDEIRTEIEQTREEMAETLDAIQDRLRPSTIVANAKAKVKAATTEKVKAMADTAGGAAEVVMERTRAGAGGVLDTLRDNPYPAAMIGIGAAWLIMKASKRRAPYGEYGRYGQSGQYRPYGSSGAYGRARSEYDLTDTQEGFATRAKEYAGETSQAIRRTGRDAQNRLQVMLNDNPLLVGAGALLIGAALGLAVPETEPENELMGDMRDSMVERAQQMASDAATKVQDTANQVAEAASNVVQSVGSPSKPV